MLILWLGNAHEDMSNKEKVIIYYEKYLMIERKSQLLLII